MFPNLNAEMARAGMSIKVLSDLTGITYESLKNKLNGVTEFKRSEMLAIKSHFDTYSLDYLFSTRDELNNYVRNRATEDLSPVLTE